MQQTATPKIPRPSRGGHYVRRGDKLAPAPRQAKQAPATAAPKKEG